MENNKYNNMHNNTNNKQQDNCSNCSNCGSVEPLPESSRPRRDGPGGDDENADS